MIQPFFVGDRPVFPVEFRGHVVGVVYAIGNGWEARGFRGESRTFLPSRQEAMDVVRDWASDAPDLTLVIEDGMILPDAAGEEG